MPELNAVPALAGEDLLERDGDLDEIVRLIERAATGSGALAIVRGPGGIGKSSLLAAGRSLALERGLECFRARGGELERDFAYGVVRQLFERRLAGASPRERRSLLDGAAALAAPALGLEPHAVAAGADSSFAAVHGLYWLAANLAQRGPLLIEVDDLHWADAASLRFLAYLAHRISELPILVLAAARPAIAKQQIELLDALAGDRSTRTLEPSPLSEAAVSRLAGARLVEGAEPAFCQACHAATGGNPFLVAALFAALAEYGVPPTADQAGRLAELATHAVSSVVVARLGRLAAGATALAQAVAVLGTDVRLGDATELAELDEREAALAADALAVQGILKAGQPLEFVHPLVRTSVRDRILPAQRSLAHGRAARLLDAGGASAERVAPHLLVAEPRGDPWVVDRMRAAARAALASGAADSAVACLQRALRELPASDDRSELLFELGTAEALTSGDAAIDHLREALACTAAPRRRAEMAEPLARALFFARRTDEAVQVGLEAVDELGTADDELRRRLEANLLNAANMHPRLRGLGDRLAARVRGQRVRDDAGARALAACVAYRDARACLTAADPVERAREALEGHVLMEADNGGAPFVQAALVLAMADSELPLEIYDAGIAAAQRQGSMFAFAANKVFRGHVLLLRGALAAAETDVREGLEAAEAYGIAIAPAWASAYLADALTEQGRLDDAGAALERAGLGPDPPDDAHAHWFLDSRARLLLACGKLGDGLAATLEAGRRFERVGGRNPAWMAWRSQAALALVGLGEDRARARALVREELELAREWGAPRALGRALRAAGLVAGGEQGLNLLREAVEVLEGSPAQLELARALADLGSTLRRSGRRAASREPLRRALELGHRCGATALAERAREELLATGARPRRIMRTGVDALTTSELRVARMAADGMTNREIAQALFVTLRTVEVHLTHTYEKLDISARRQLPAALAAGAG